MGSYFNFVIEVMKCQPPIVYIPVWTHSFVVIRWVSLTIVITNISTAFSRRFFWLHYVHSEGFSTWTNSRKQGRHKGHDLFGISEVCPVTSISGDILNHLLSFINLWKDISGIKLTTWGGDYENQTRWHMPVDVFKKYFKGYIFRVVLGSQQDWRVVQRFSHAPFPHTCTASFIIRVPTWMVQVF